MTELTLSQWKERALVAEALLEERTTELEGLRAEMEDLKARQPVRDKRAEYWEMYKGQVRDIDPTQYFTQMMTSDEQFRELMKGEQFKPGEIEMLMKYMMQMPEWTDQRGPRKMVVDPKTHPPSPTRRGGEDDFRRFQQHAPQFDIENVQCELTPDGPEKGGAFRVGFEYKGKTWCAEINPDDFRERIRRPDGVQIVASTVAEYFKREVGLGTRNMDVLRYKLGEAIAKMMRERPERY